MLRKTRDLTGYRVYATDGDIGRLMQFYFDPETWTIRYLVVQTGEWHGYRQVLVAPMVIKNIDDKYKLVQVNLKHDQVQQGPEFSFNRPLTRRFEKEYYDHHGWPVYWGADDRWGGEARPSDFFTAAPFNKAEEYPQNKLNEIVLHSTNELTGFAAFAQNEKMGYVEGFIFDDDSWAIRFAVIDASSANMVSVLISPHWISDLSLGEKLVEVDIPLEHIRGAPPYDPTRQLTRDEEVDQFRYYGRMEDLDRVFVRQRVGV